MKKIHTTLLIVLILLALTVTPVLAVGVMQEADPFSALTMLMTALLAAPGIGAGLTILIQLGKMFLPNYFPDETAQNWRLGAVLVIALLIYFVPMIYPPALEWLTVLKLDALAQSFSEFFGIVAPLFVLLANWFSKITYTAALRGTFVLGFSHTLKAKAAKK